MNMEDVVKQVEEMEDRIWESMQTPTEEEYDAVEAAINAAPVEPDPDYAEISGGDNSEFYVPSAMREALWKALEADNFLRKIASSYVELTKILEILGVLYKT